MKVLITGSSGTIGSLLVAAWSGKHDLRLVDVVAAHADTSVVDVSADPSGWRHLLEGCDAVVHLAAVARAEASWSDLVGANIDGTLNVFEAAASCGVGRFVFASSNHVMGGYRGRCGPGEITVDLAPAPGTSYVRDGILCDTTPYACTKLFGERVGHQIARTRPVSVVVARIGLVLDEKNDWRQIPEEWGIWFRQMWLSNTDCVRLLTLCLGHPLDRGFVLVNGVSNNRDMPWDVEQGRRSLGYYPVDGASL